MLATRLNLKEEVLLRVSAVLKVDVDPVVQLSPSHLRNEEDD